MNRRAWSTCRATHEYLRNYSATRVQMGDLVRGVTFATKGGHECTLSGVEFLRRFVDHVLPKGFTRIRHYGLLAPCHATTITTLAVGSGASPPTWVERLMALTGIDADRCVRCGVGRLVRHPLDGRRTSSCRDTL